MREDFWSFDPSHTFVMLTNHKPGRQRHRRGHLAAAAARALRGDHPRPPNATRTWAAKLAGEAGAILAWLVAGYLDWRKNGLAEPEKVTEATQAYRADSDPLGRFLDERVRQGEPIQRPQQPPVRGLREMVCRRARGPRHAEVLRRRHEGQGLRELPVQRACTGAASACAPGTKGNQGR